MHRPVLITPPAVLPIELADVKAQIELDGTDRDNLLNTYIAGAVAHLDGPRGVLGRCMIRQTWAQDFDAWEDLMRLPVPDVGAVTLTWRDAEGAVQTAGAGDYDLIEDDTGAVLQLTADFARPAPGPLVRGIRATVTAGLATSAAGLAQVAGGLRVAMLLHVGHMFASREAVVTGTIATELPLGYADLIAPWRRGMI